MQAWDDIINIAMIGTDKKQPDTISVPASLAEITTRIITGSEKNREEQFLQLASLLYNYQRCGISPLKKETAGTAAPVEEKKYCSTHAALALRDVLQDDNHSLLQYWLERCDSRTQIAPARFVPALLINGERNKKLRLLISSCVGKRGEWLSGFNTAWDFSAKQTQEEIWQTGSLEERQEVLQQTLVTDPLKAREWIRQTWQQEDAATKLVLLSILAPFADESDIDFLEGLSKEKSKKLQLFALESLRTIPGSPIVLMYESFLRSAVTIQKETSMLGFSKKNTLQCKLPDAVSEDLYKTGIDKLSSDKTWTDDEYVVFQVMQYVPPSFWEKTFQLSAEALLELFEKTDTGKKLLPALTKAAANFRDRNWANVIAQRRSVFQKELLPLLPLAPRDSYINHFFAKNINDVMDYAKETDEPWSMEMTRLILREAAKKPYPYVGFFQKVIAQIPVAVSTELSSYPVSEDQYSRSLWSGMSEEISRTLAIKNQINNAFTI
ncbi:DUF5691 domain-containing protein [Terrimonas sp. NA20]|uniref:DUF5691 domain-containing protein n=1 Tax=Terrimonas ginsenosidimutans TaxID=2908004 RepID=A0ABS9KN84_9BACT|nr:DUF5691 domain-containing protein [Terrimonas ginsenosidimutans]MCG2613774.1 DUF5691 domain-containing protein [Terrimonas ginsenosidimutans]